MGDYSVDLDFEKLTIKEMETIIENPLIKVLAIEQSTNNYGEFLFINLLDTETKYEVQYYGVGFNDCADKPIYYFKDVQSNKAKNCRKQGLNKNQVIEVIYSRKRELEAEYKNYKPSSNGKLFEELVDSCGDEDGIKSMMEDLGYEL